jgi:hypothetical protein
MAQAMSSNTTPQNEANLIQLTRPAPNVRAVLTRDAEYVAKRHAEGKTAFPDRQFSAYYYERDLIGYPFFFATVPQFGQYKGNFDVQDVARCGIWIVQDDYTLTEPVVAQFAHKYLLSDLKGQTEQELFGHCWTLARNESLPPTPRGEHPITLKIYEMDADAPEDEEGPIEWAPTPAPQTPPTPPDTAAARAWPLPSSDQMNAARERFGLGSGSTVDSQPPRWQTPPQQAPEQPAPVKRRGPGRPPKLHA